MRNGNVLIVEDDDAIRRLLIDCFEQRGTVHVDGARDGVEALHRIESARYDVVVLDLMMPKMTGVDLLDSLRSLAIDRSLDGERRLPDVVVITSKAEEEVPTAALERRFGFVRAVFRKPFDLSAVAAEVERACGGPESSRAG